MKKKPEYNVMRAIAETFVASLKEEEYLPVDQLYMTSVAKDLQVSSELRLDYYKFKASDIHGIGQSMFDYLMDVAPADKITRLLLVLKMLNTAFGTWILCAGGLARFASFPQLSVKDRQLALKRLEASWISEISQLYRVFYTIAMIQTYGVDLRGQLNRTWQTLNYDGPDYVNERFDIADSIWRPNFLDIKKYLKNTEKNIAVLEYDIVVVGSGCGAGPIAKELSEDGYKVLVIEKANYVPPEKLPMTELDGLSMHYEKKGGLYSEDFSMQVLAATTWGGGSSVNWSASFQPPNQLRQEWSDRFGLNHFTRPDFQKGVEAVCQRLGVTENINHNVPNSLFLDGCKSLGIHGDFIKQNTAGQPHDCGYCTFTCPTGTKQSSAITWMKDAAEFGCHFLDGLEVDKVVHNAGIATGVTGKKEGIRVIIKSKKIVLSCGSMSTPNLLLKSNIPNLNRHVGKHLRLHPVTLVFGVFPDKDISPHKGSIMTTYSNVVGDLDSMGYGAKLEIPVSHPGIFASSLYWHSDVSHKNKMMIWRHTASVIVLTRDKDSEGTIWVDKEGKTRFDWKFGEFDSCSMIKGMEAGIKILLAAGAKEVYTTQRDHPESFKRDSNMSAEQVFESEEYKSYISKMKKVGAKQAKLSIFSAHQMGTCRMANDAKNGVVDSHGRMHGLKNVYIADASVFPTSSGVK